MILHLGTGAPSPRLYAPGAPDWIGADGHRLGWVQRDRLFLLEGGLVRVVELPDLVEEVCASPEGWVVAMMGGFARVNPTTATLDLLLADDEADPVTTRAGADVVLFVEVPEQRLLQLASGDQLTLPDAALRARFLRPWARGRGACWVDSDLLYRMGERTSALGKAPGAEGIACGPDGAVAVALGADTVVAPPRGLAIRLGRRLDVDGVRFSPDGRHLLGADEEGVVLVELATGVVLRTWEGDLRPVGWAPGVVLQDGARLVDADGATLLDGLAGAGPSQAGRLLCGPGGAVWDLEAGTRRLDGLGEGVFATDGERVVHATEATVTVIGGARFAHDLGGTEDPLARARLEGEEILLATVDGQVARYRLDGTRLAGGRGRRTPRRVLPAGVRVAAADAPSEVTVDGARMPLPVSGAARAGGGVWLWNEDGMLVRVGGPSAG